MFLLFTINLSGLPQDPSKIVFLASFPTASVCESYCFV